MQTPKRLKAWIILFALVLIWGSSFILIKKGLIAYSNQAVGALRITITFLFLLPFIFSRLKKLHKKDWYTLLWVGLIGSGAPAFLFAKAQTGLDSSMAGILNSLTPLFTLLLGSLFFGLKTLWINRAGIVVGLIGATGLLMASADGALQFNFYYALFVIIATICYAINVNIVKSRLQHLDSLTITAFSFLLIGIPVSLYLFTSTDFLLQLQHHPQALSSLAYIAILSVVGTGMALIGFNWLIHLTSPVFASSVTYMIPVVAILWGLFDGEIFKPTYFAWIGLILIGVYLVNTQKAAAKSAE